MYTIVLAMMLTEGGSIPAWHHGSGGGCLGSCGCYDYSCCCGGGTVHRKVYSRLFHHRRGHHHGYAGCHGCYSCAACSCHSCHSCHACFGCTAYSCSGCHGCYGSSGYYGYSDGYSEGIGVPGVPVFSDDGVVVPQIPLADDTIPPTTAPQPSSDPPFPEAVFLPNPSLTDNVTAPLQLESQRNALPTSSSKGVVQTAIAASSEESASNRVRITVNLPEDARLWVDHVECPLTSSVRSFRTQPLNGNQQYFYDLKVELTRDGRTISQTQRVVITPGHEVRVDFTKVGAVNTVSR